MHIILNNLRKSKLLIHSQTTNFNASKLNEVAGDNFEFDENGRKLMQMSKTLVVQTRKKLGLVSLGTR